jgi:hypothetical protein
MLLHSQDPVCAPRACKSRFISRPFLPSRGRPNIVLETEEDPRSRSRTKTKRYEMKRSPQHNTLTCNVPCRPRTAMNGINSYHHNMPHHRHLFVARCFHQTNAKRRLATFSADSSHVHALGPGVHPPSFRSPAQCVLPLKDKLTPLRL